MKITTKALCAVLLSAACSSRNSAPDPAFEVTDTDDTSGETNSSDASSNAENAATETSEVSPDAGASTTSDAGETTSDESSTSGSSDTTDEDDTGDSGCFKNPKTHFEIINACTEAVVIHKTPNLTGLNPDGSLPPLP